MTTLLCLLLLPVNITAQTEDETQLVALTISYDPHETGSENEYYLLADVPETVK